MASTSGNSIGKNCGDIVFKAARKCLGFDIPFAVCHLPGNDTLDFFCGLETSPHSSGDTPEKGKSFEIGKWLAPWADRISIGTRLTPSRAAALEASDLSDCPGLSSSPAMTHPDRVISRDEYSAAVSAITGRCRLRDGKTVYSRVIAGTNPLLDIPEAARELFRAFPDSFGFLYSTPRTGCWLGASPETLLDFDAATRRVSTMAFAGTRPATCGDAPWDDKNLRENRFVADYIRDKFRQLAIEPETSSPRTVRYGVI
ncbi:MAG: chorismate-binding protein, partial [Muribaculaceae bacterium]|nr:chorismate-binding protein [Muribaculaceae bacterium]